MNIEKMIPLEYVPTMPKLVIKKSFRKTCDSFRNLATGYNGRIISYDPINELSLELISRKRHYSLFEKFSNFLSKKIFASKSNYPSTERIVMLKDNSDGIIAIAKDSNFKCCRDRVNIPKYVRFCMENLSDFRTSVVSKTAAKNNFYVE